MPLFPRRRPRGRGYRCFFATDLHGSDRCFRKFLAAASAYEADVLVLGGDVAGKAIVPVEKCAGGKLRFSFMGVDEEVDESDLAAITERINFNGMYPWLATGDEIAAASSDKELRERLFEEAITRQMAMWCDLAGDRLAAEKRIIITPGNDDPLFVDAVLDASPRIESPEREVVEMGPVWLASLGSTTPTPWNTHREFSEDELRQQIRDILQPYADGRPLVFNFHCPPADTGLDTVAKLDSDFRPIVARGSAELTSGGSVAVREAVLEYRPVVALFGHIHEAHGAVRLGDTWCINPGSDYSAGVLKGAIVDFDATGRYKTHLLTQG
jgi:Icc-related predicted phosphoesterase